MNIPTDRLRDFIGQQFLGLNRLFHEHNLDARFPSLNEQICERVTNYFVGSIGR